MFVFFSQQVGVAKKTTDIIPYGFVQFVGANLFVVAHTFGELVAGLPVRGLSMT